MTGQIHDTLIYNDEKYSIVAYDFEDEKNELFTPISYGIFPISTCTACWKGFLLTYYYDHEKKQFILDKLLTNAMNDEVYDINGISPKRSEDDLFKYVYKNLNIPLKKTGKLIFAKDFIYSLYVHMGFQAMERFKTVYEATIKNGIVIDIKDISNKMKEIRKKKYKENYDNPEP